MAKIDWARASGGTLKNGDKLLKELAAGKQPAYDALAAASVGRPLAAVLVPALVPMAAKPLALRLLASIAEALDERDVRGTKRVMAALKSVKVSELLVDKNADVRAAAAVLAGALGEKKGVKEALAAEVDVRAKVCQLVTLGDAKLAKSYLGDKDLAVATAAATIARDAGVLIRGIGDASLDDMPWPGRSLRAFAARALLASAFPKKLTGKPSAKQLEVIRALLAVAGGESLVMGKAWELGLPTDVETVRRIAGVRTPVPEGWALGVEVVIGKKRDSALGHYLEYMQTGEGDANAIAQAIVESLDAKRCARAVLEICQSNCHRFEGELKAPALPKGGKLGAKKNWEDWTIYKDKTEEVVAGEYVAQLTKAGWTIVGHSYDAGDATKTPDARIKAIRAGLELDGTFYRQDKAGACVLVGVEPELFPAFVAAAFDRHAKAFVTALVAVASGELGDWGNVGYWLPYAALLVAQRTKTVPDAAFDSLVIKHQGEANVLLAAHLAYIALLPAARQQDVVAGILAYGHRSLAKMYPSDKAFAAAARGLARSLDCYGTYDDARRKDTAQSWAFLGDHAVPAIESALKAKKVGNPDVAAQILAEIGTPAATKALGKLAKHTDKTVKKIVAAALA